MRRAPDGVDLVDARQQLVKRLLDLLVYVFSVPDQLKYG